MYSGRGSKPVSSKNRLVEAIEPSRRLQVHSVDLDKPASGPVADLYVGSASNGGDDEADGGWTIHRNAETGKRFSHRESTGESKWLDDNDDDEMEQAVEAADGAAPDISSAASNDSATGGEGAASSSAWETFVDESSGRRYRHHPGSGATEWIDPSDEEEGEDEDDGAEEAAAGSRKATAQQGNLWVSQRHKKWGEAEEV